MDYEFRPLVDWPGDRTHPSKRKRSTFSGSYASTLKTLACELRHLQATSIVIQADCEDHDIRNDGLLRSSAKVMSPAIILSFNSKYGPLSYPCDTFTDWQSNLRAIALALDCLRRVDRYGVTRRAEQYKGWSRLPPPEPEGVKGAAKVLAELLEENVRVTRENLDELYRRAALKTHPDHGGNADDFKRAQNARDVLAKHFGLAT